MIALLASLALAAPAGAQGPALDEADEAASAPPAADVEITEATAAIVSAALERAALYAERPDSYEPPRLATGKPDLQGDWSTATNTPFARAARHPNLVLTREEAIQAIASHPQNVRQATDDNQSLEDGLLTGSDLARGRGYNAFWIDPGTSYAMVKGEWRSSWITYPEDGQLPDITEAGRAAQAAMAARYSGAREDNPEERSLAERCILGLSQSGGPPITSSLYNNNISIVQTPSHVVILAEMNHDARIVRLDAAHRGDGVEPWMGDSIGWWEGDTLVVETVDIHPAQRAGRTPLSENAVITERFTRWNDHQLVYEFEVDDPAFYADVWRGEMAFNKTGERVFEYACHEGNYGLEGILAAGRRADGTLEERAGGEE
jgi:hypothetical protein